MAMSRLAASGDLERVGHGVYQLAAAPQDRFAALKAAWIATNPVLTAEERLARGVDVVVSGPTASWLLGIGTLQPEPYEFSARGRRQAQRSGIRYRLRDLPAELITIRAGLPVTTLRQTITDLANDDLDRSMLADVVADASRLDPSLRGMSVL